MNYAPEILPTAQRDLRALSPEVAARIVRKIDAMRNDLAGDVKRLVRHSPAYRLRVGDYRVLFDVDGTTLKIQRVLHRSSACD